MTKIILGFGVAGFMLVLGTYLFITQDKSKVAEMVKEENFEVKVSDVSDSKMAEQKVVAEKDNKAMDGKMAAGEVEKMEDKMPTTQTPTIKSSPLLSGSFNKIDPLHYAAGQVTVERSGENYKLKFASNFSSADGPDLYVYLAEPQNFKNIAIGGVDTEKTINLGLLKKLSGQQEYLVSKNDFEKNNGAVIIWCKQFGVQFSRAELK